MMEFLKKKKTLMVFLILMISILVMVILTYPQHVFLIAEGYPGTESCKWGDAWHYYSMALNPFNPKVDAPFCYRILTPLIIYLLPLDPIVGYWWFTVLCIGITTLLLYYYLKRLKFNMFYCFLGTMVFIIAIPNLYLMFYTIFVDPLQYLIFILGCLIILNIGENKLSGVKEIIIFTIFLSIGILNKETIIFLMPLYGMVTKGNIGLKLTKSIVCSIPCAIIYILLRTFIPFSGYSFEGIWIIHHFQNWQNTIFNIFLPFLLFLFLAIPGFYRKNKNDESNKSFLKKFSLLMPFFILQIALASDFYRNIFLAFPLIIPLGVITIHKLENFYFSKGNIQKNHNNTNKNSHLISYIVLFFQIFIPIFYFLQWDVPINLNIEFLRIFYFGAIIIGYIFVCYILMLFYWRKWRNKLI